VAVLGLLLAPRLARAGVAVVLMAVSFAFFGGYERLREGVRKPFLIHSHLFSNGLLVDQIDDINATGLAAHSGWVARGDSHPAALGERLFRAQCASCHTLKGYQAITEALPTVEDMILVAADDPPGAGELHYRRQCAACHRDVGYAEMIGMMPSLDEIRSDPDFVRDLNLGMVSATMIELRDMGDDIAGFDRHTAFDTLDRPYMPPFVGTEEEAEALAIYLASLDSDRDIASGGGR
jgi:mono/diheme cytochrome c family protein